VLNNHQSSCGVSHDNRKRTIAEDSSRLSSLGESERCNPRGSVDVSFLGYDVARILLRITRVAKRTLVDQARGDIQESPL